MTQRHLNAQCDDWQSRSLYRGWRSDFALGMKWGAFWVPVLTLAFVALAAAAEMFGGN